MPLIIDNYCIDTSIMTIINQVKLELTNGKLRDVRDKNSSILLSCPHHKGGLENKPACTINCKEDENNIPYGYTYCFVCGFKGSLYHFIGECFDKDDRFGKDWLIERFGNTYITKDISFKEIKLPQKYINASSKNKYLDENILDNFQTYHPYMTERKLSRDIINKFKIRYDTEKKCIVFPIWDEFNNLVMLTRRSVIRKEFIIDENIEKPVYLLNTIINEKIKNVYVCESQINALTLWSWGYPAIALLGTGSKYQYSILNKTEITSFTLCFDGDLGGKKGISNFIKNVKGNVFIDIVNIPIGKDVNDLTKEEFDYLVGAKTLL